MNLKHPKRHHFVPKVYLKAWADQNNMVGLRRRQGTRHSLTNIGNVALVKGFHGSGQEASDREAFFNEMEGRWPSLRAWLLIGKLSSSTERREVARFLAYQRLRTREERTRAEFHETALKFLSERPITAEAMQIFLVEQWGLKDPSPAEVQGACDYLEIFRYSLEEEGQNLKIDSISMPGHADTYINIIDSYSWRVERMPSLSLFTSDSPVVYWRPRTPQDHIEGIGLDNAREIWFPIDPQHLLVLTKTSGKSGIWSVSKQRLQLINLEIAARSFEAVIASTACGAELDSLFFRANKPALRFNIGPRIGVAADGTEHPMGEILHTWVPAYDDV